MTRSSRSEEGYSGKAPPLAGCDSTASRVSFRVLPPGAGQSMCWPTCKIKWIGSSRSAAESVDFGSGIGFASKAKQANEEEQMKSTIQNALKRVFSPEFLNRLDDVIIFNSLQREHIHKIIDITLGKLFKRITAIGYTVELSDKAKDFLAEKGSSRYFWIARFNGLAPNW